MTDKNTKKPKPGISVKPKTGTETNIIGCNVIGMVFDTKAIAAVQQVAEALTYNAKACGRLAEVFKTAEHPMIMGHGINIESPTKE